jgi:uncharacterized membrane protein YidH (DUF202 family)
LIISIDRHDGSHDGMNVTISVELLKAYLGGNIKIDHSTNVSAIMTNETVTVYIEHFSTQSLTAEGLGTPPNTAVLVSFIFVVTAVILFIAYSFIHYKQSKNLLNTKNMETMKKVTLGLSITLFILAIVEYVSPFMYL